MNCAKNLYGKYIVERVAIGLFEFNPNLAARAGKDTRPPGWEHCTPETHELYRRMAEIALSAGEPRPLDSMPFTLEDLQQMSREELERRLLNQRSFITSYARCLDGIPEIQNLAGGGIDACRMSDNIRYVVTGLIKQQQRAAAQKD